MEETLIIIYGSCLLFIFSYSIIQLSLALRYRSTREKDGARLFPHVEPKDLPIVTIQLPVFNEFYVVERLLESVSKLRYPIEKLEIQLLDDSTDESFAVGSKKVAELKALGYDVVQIKRPERKGYKAGALAYGLEIAKGEFTAIFDADFVPNPDFLEKTIPPFLDNDKIGVVQTRWEHLNKDYSWLTELQAFGLDAHFTVEQGGRYYGGHFINFNGTAGVWRKKCIQDAGGWQSDTLTEDLDLSYRAQLNGWKFLYLEGVESPAELPAEMNALKSQQFRWTKGAAECAVKNLPKVMRKKGLGLGTKVHAIFHLMNSFLFICILSTAMLSIPMLFVKANNVEYALLFQLASVFLLSFVILSYFYWLSMKGRKEDFWGTMSDFVLKFPLFLSVSMGMSLHNSIAVLEGYAGKKSPFIRTPKFAISGEAGSWKEKRYRALKANPLTILELLLAIYFLVGIGLAFYLNDYGLLPFHIMLTLGFGFVAFYSIKHTRA